MAHQLTSGDVRKLGVPAKAWKSFDLEPDAGRAWLRYQSALRVMGSSPDCVCRWVAVDGEKRLRVRVDPMGVDLFRQCAEVDPKANIATKALILDKIGAAVIPTIRIGISIAIGSDQTGSQSGPPDDPTDPGAGGGGKGGGK